MHKEPLFLIEPGAGSDSGKTDALFVCDVDRIKRTTLSLYDFNCSKRLGLANSSRHPHFIGRQNNIKVSPRRSRNDTIFHPAQLGRPGCLGASNNRSPEHDTAESRRHATHDSERWTGYGRRTHAPRTGRGSQLHLTGYVGLCAAIASQVRVVTASAATASATAGSGRWKR